MHQVEINELSEEPVGFDVSAYPGGMYGMSVKIENRKRMTNLFVVTKM